MVNMIKKAAITVLAVLGALFLLIMIWPEDETAEAEADTEETGAETAEETEAAEETETSGRIAEAAENAGGVSTAADQNSDEEASGEPEQDSDEGASGEAEPEDGGQDENELGSAGEAEASEEQAEGKGDAAVNIPDGKLSDSTLRFSAMTLDNDRVSQDIFSDYDITVVYVWGTYCSNCINEMGDYARLYEKLPDNVNLVGIVCDVYEGMEVNADDAREILEDAGAGFTNLRDGDSLYDILVDIRFLPSSFLVDRQGHIIGKKLDGFNCKDTVKELSRYVDIDL